MAEHKPYVKSGALHEIRLRVAGIEHPVHLCRENSKPEQTKLEQHNRIINGSSLFRILSRLYFTYSRYFVSERISGSEM